jgi:hypothetical protein
MRRVRRLRLQRHGNDLFDPIVTDLAWCATSGLIIKTVEAMFGETAAPHANGVASNAHSI